jgi:cytochrome P450
MTVQLPFDQAYPLDVGPLLRRDQFRAWSEAVGDSRDRARSEQGLSELFIYGQQLVARKRNQLGDNFISRLCADGLGDDEIAMLSMALLLAGHETTVAAIGLGALCLLANPGQRQALIDDRDGSPPRWRRYCVPRAGAAAAFPATPVPTCRSGRLPCMRATWCCWIRFPARPRPPGSAPGC